MDEAVEASLPLQLGDVVALLIDFNLSLATLEGAAVSPKVRALEIDLPISVSSVIFREWTLRA